jgi:hypothetical protein
MKINQETEKSMGDSLQTTLIKKTIECFCDFLSKKGYSIVPKVNHLIAEKEYLHVIL